MKTSLIPTLVLVLFSVAAHADNNTDWSKWSACVLGVSERWKTQGGCLNKSEANCVDKEMGRALLACGKRPLLEGDAKQETLQRITNACQTYSYWDFYLALHDPDIGGNLRGWARHLKAKDAIAACANW